MVDYYEMKMILWQIISFGSAEPLKVLSYNCVCINMVFIFKVAHRYNY